MVVLFEWEGEEAFEAFRNDPSVKETMGSSGTVGPPEFTFLEKVGGSRARLRRVPEGAGGGVCETPQSGSGFEGEQGLGRTSPGPCSSPVTVRRRRRLVRSSPHA